MASNVSRLKIDRACAKVARTLDRALREAELEPSRLVGPTGGFSDGWPPLPTLRGLSDGEDAAEAMAKLDETLRRHDQVLTAALLAEGMPKTVLDLLRNWMAVQMGARLALVAAATSTAHESPQRGQPGGKRRQR
jgi:hypothetical protein